MLVTTVPGTIRVVSFSSSGSISIILRVVGGAGDGGDGVGVVVSSFLPWVVSLFSRLHLCFLRGAAYILGVEMLAPLGLAPPHSMVHCWQLPHSGFLAEHVHFLQNPQGRLGRLYTLSFGTIPQGARISFKSSLWAVVFTVGPLDVAAGIGGVGVVSTVGPPEEGVASGGGVGVVSTVGPSEVGAGDGGVGVVSTVGSSEVWAGGGGVGVVSTVGPSIPRVSPVDVVSIVCPSEGVGAGSGGVGVVSTVGPPEVGAGSGGAGVVSTVGPSGPIGTIPNQPRSISDSWLGSAIRMVFFFFCFF